jgi:Lamin Tail Domain
MVFINEWLPNPTGNDAAGEFVELFNNGNAPVNLAGWSLMSRAKKRERLAGMIGANEYKVFYRKQTKLVLKNADEGIALYDSAGKLVDESSFVGTASEGKSFGRTNNVSTYDVDTRVQQFAWGKPTPGAANEVMRVAVTQVATQPFDVPINRETADAGAFFAAMFGIGVLLTGVILYSIKTHEDLSDIFFSRDEAIG